MLKGIPDILNPELLKVMMEMGHGDELLIADGNYPRFGHPERVIRMDGHGIPEILDAILQFLPLDPYVEQPVTLMDVLPGDPYKPEVWDTFREIIFKYEPTLNEDSIAKIHKKEFYPQGNRCYAVVTTGEKALYANIILKKGVVK